MHPEVAVCKTLDGLYTGNRDTKRHFPATTHHCSNQQTHLAVLLTKVPPVMVTTVGFSPPEVVPQATIAPPCSIAWLPVNVPPSIVTLEPPKPVKSPEQ